MQKYIVTYYETFNGVDSAEACETYCSEPPVDTETTKYELWTPERYEEVFGGFPF